MEIMKHQTKLIVDPVFLPCKMVTALQCGNV